jgi:hypothetical protein
MSNHFHQSLANKFNRKKTINNDISRISCIHKKPNSVIPVLKHNNIPVDIIEPVKPAETLYQFNKVTTSTTLNIDVSREKEHKNIPKITFKEVPIPYYSSNDKFDLNNINQNISIPIQMDMFASDVINDIGIHRLKKRRVAKIYHIYQEKYADGNNATGFGDFIRSCFFIVQFGLKYGFTIEILINHPIAEFLHNHQHNKVLNKLFNNVSMFDSTNWNKSIFDNKNNITQFILSQEKYNLFINHLSLLPVVNNTILSYNILFPLDAISPKEISKIKSIFEPTREMVDYTDETLTLLNLAKNNYIVLHIRSGDTYLKGENKSFHPLYLEIIKTEICEIIFTARNPILLIADNNEIKYLLRDAFPDCKLYFKNITHMGEGVELERVKVKNTLLDFYLMSYATQIYSFTAYPHGSGFSYWCSKIYEIPYNCKYINVQ